MPEHPNNTQELCSSTTHTAYQNQQSAWDKMRWLARNRHLAKLQNTQRTYMFLELAVKTKAEGRRKRRRAAGTRGADVCGRLVFQQWPKTEAARTYRGYAQIAPDVRPAITELQRFNRSIGADVGQCAHRGGQAMSCIKTIVRGAGGHGARGTKSIVRGCRGTGFLIFEFSFQPCA